MTTIIRTRAPQDYAWWRVDGPVDRFALQSDGSPVAWLEIDASGAYGMLFAGGRRVAIKRDGRRQVTVCDDDTVLASFRRGITSRGTVEITGGASVRWMGPSFMGYEAQFTGVDGSRLLRFAPDGATFSYVTGGAGGVGWDEQPGPLVLLLALGWFLLQTRRR
jgi:hypothetical protein